MYGKSATEMEDMGHCRLVAELLALVEPRDGANFFDQMTNAWKFSAAQSHISPRSYLLLPRLPSAHLGRGSNALCR